MPSTTATKPTTTTDKIDYRERNDALFARRAQLRLELAEAEDAAERHPAGTAEAGVAKRNLRRTRRAYDNLINEIVEENIGLVHTYVRKFSGTAPEATRDDYISAGREGLIAAISTYEPSEGKFAPWAYKRILRLVLRQVRASEHSNLNPVDFERRPAILRAVREVYGDNRTQVDYQKVADYVTVTSGKTCTLEQVFRVLDAPRLTSLATPAGGDNDDSFTVGDMIADETADVAGGVVHGATIDALERHGLPKLTERERFVIVRRFGLDGSEARKLAEIGDALGLSREAVRQIEARALAKLNHPITIAQLTGAAA